MFRGKTLAGRLALTISVVALVSVAITALISFGLVRQFAEREAERELDKIAEAIAEEMQAGSFRAPAELRTVRRIAASSGAEVALVGPTGQIQGAGSAVASRIDELPRLIDGQKIRGSVETPEGVFVYTGFPVPSGPISRGVILLQPVNVARESGGLIFQRVLLAGAAALVIAIVVSLVVAQRLGRPLRSLDAATKQIAEGDLEHRVEVESEDELGRLALGFNAMASRLGESSRRESEFLSNVSHELRTPVTAIRGYVEALVEGAVSDEESRREALEVIATEVARLERLVTDVTDLARLGAKEFGLHVSEVNLSDTIDEAIAAHRGEAERGGIELTSDVDKQLRTKTDGARFRQVISNLLDNSLRVTPEGGRVSISAQRDAGVFIFDIKDTGPGISPGHLPHIFERAYLRKVSAAGDGSGLGLAIVRELVNALGGQVSVDSEIGEGTTFRVVLPEESD